MKMEGMDQHFCLRWQNHASNFVGAVGRLLQQQLLTDVTLVCKGQTFEVHQTVLAACSPYFESLFTLNKIDHPVFLLKDIKSSEMTALLDFMYKGEVNVSQSSIQGVLKAAEILKIRGLTEDCDSGSSGKDCDGNRTNGNPISNDSIETSGGTHHNANDCTTPSRKRRVSTSSNDDVDPLLTNHQEISSKPEHGVSARPSPPVTSSFKRRLLSVPLIKSNFDVKFDFDVDEYFGFQKDTDMNEQLQFAVGSKKQKQSRTDIPRPFKCPTCGFSYTTEHVLKQHVQNHHTTTTFECTPCSKSFTSRTLLNNHNRKVHSGNGQHPCDICGKVLKTKGTLNKHKVKHTKRFWCEPCKVGFNSKDVLDRHVESHVRKTKKKNGLLSKEKKEQLKKFGQEEIARLKTYMATLVDPRVEIPAQVYVTTPERTIMKVPSTSVEMTVPTILLYIPYKKEFRTHNKLGHFLVSSAIYPFQDVLQQLQKSSEVSDYRTFSTKGCTHVTRDLLAKRQYDYANHVIAAVADDPDTGRDLKFKTNEFFAVSNTTKKDPRLDVTMSAQVEAELIQQLEQNGVPLKK